MNDKNNKDKKGTSPRAPVHEDVMCDVKNIIEVYLTNQGYDGLYNSDGECGCEVGDLFPCDESPVNCIPGYKSQCTEECQHEGREGGWHMGKVKT